MGTPETPAEQRSVHAGFHAHQLGSQGGHHRVGSSNAPGRLHRMAKTPITFAPATMIAETDYVHHPRVHHSKTRLVTQIDSDDPRKDLVLQNRHLEPCLQD